MNREPNKSENGNSEQLHHTPTKETNVIKFEEICQGRREVIIEYRNEQYRLLATKNGKLVLNK